MNEKVIYNFDMCKYADIEDLDCEKVKCNFECIQEVNTEKDDDVLFLDSITD